MAPSRFEPLSLFPSTLNSMGSQTTTTTTTTIPHSKTMTVSEPVIVRDIDYFLETIFILVENTMFQIPKHYVAQIDIFSTTFSLPPREDGVEGPTEKKPLVLHQITTKDFKAFLKVLIPLQIPHSYSNIHMDEWISTLKLSTMWEALPLRELAIRHLVNQLDAVNLILLGSGYLISQWFLNGCTKLINRTQGPTEEEGNCLGMRLTVQIYGIRERMTSHRIARGPGVPFDCQRALKEAFPDKIYE